MYKFIKPHELRENPSFMSIQTIFNGINLDQVLNNENGVFQTLEVNGRHSLSFDIYTDEISNVDGVSEGNKRLEPKEITVKYKVKGYSNEKFVKLLNELNGYLTGSKKSLVFTDEKDATFYATLVSNELEDENSNDLEGVLTFLCSDPVKYKNVKSIKSEDSNIFIDGTYPTSIKIKVRLDESVPHVDFKLDDEMLRLHYDFEPKDVIEVDFEKEKVYINGKLDMSVIDLLHADFFKLKAGLNKLEIKPKTFVEIDYREGWL